ncbi:LAQU0S14e01552g1_1 [Lachancea quebecensis]|uniref:LAQU0S14e01552g1_1 n=1 Tax=Lachancea quebecensis TaxID=1654605 RepID=A0A0P1KXL8_9SACH|nr:LAQU0S14e01552g1_1 [Lachancea quebecensis]
MLYQHARAMSHVSVYYATEGVGINELLHTLLEVLNGGNKLVFLGSGKSFKIILKTVAMLTSLGIDSRYLHPSEALHGDMGAVRPGDALVVCSSSGETQELVQFLEHAGRVLEPSVRVLVTSSTNSTLHRLVDQVLYVPQPVQFQEKTLQDGLPSPTVSTTLMLTVLDCFCLALTELYFDGDTARRREFFRKMHPGGGIGKQLQVPVPVPVPILGPVALHRDTSAAPTDSTICGHVPEGASESEFLQSIVQFDYCVVAGVRYNSHVLQHRYREWKRSRPTSSLRYTAEDGVWNLTALLMPAVAAAN